MSESFKPITLDTSHRLNGHDIEDPNALTLSDAVDHMVERATASIDAVKEGFFPDSTAHLDDKTIYFLLNSALMELSDIQALIESNHRFHQDKKQA